MKIASGEFKNRTLKVKDIKGLRPTAALIRESLFNIPYIKSAVSGSEVLDIFAGTGGVGIEFLSNGAKRAVFIENNRRVVEILRNNLEALNLTKDRVKVFPIGLHSAIKAIFEQGFCFDFVFIDPPYRTNLVEKALSLLVQYIEILKDGAILICEVEKGREVLIPEEFVLVQRRNYHDTDLLILKKRDL